MKHIFEYLFSKKSDIDKLKNWDSELHNLDIVELATGEKYLVLMDPKYYDSNYMPFKTGSPTLWRGNTYILMTYYSSKLTNTHDKSMNMIKIWHKTEKFDMTPSQAAHIMPSDLDYLTKYIYADSINIKKQ